MYLHSRLNKENVTLYEIDVKDERCRESFITQHDIKYSSDDINVEGVIYATDGFFIVETTFDLAQSCTNVLVKKGEYIQISLLLTGSIATFKKKLNKVKDIKAGLLQLVFRGDTEVAMEMQGNNGPLRYIRVFASREFYLSLLKNESWVTAWEFYRKVEKGEFVHFGENLIPVTPAILNILSDILSNNHQADVKKYYIEHKLKELYLQSFISDEAGKNIPSIIDETGIKLESARAYLTTHYFKPPTIKQLSRIISLNELKLKTGFKEKFGITIHEYITQSRMQNAKRMLIDNQSVNDVAVNLGYKGVSHFITSFKKFYGITPKQAIQTKIFSSDILRALSLIWTYCIECADMFSI